MQEQHERGNTKLRRALFRAVLILFALLFVVAAALFRGLVPQSNIISPYTMSEAGPQEMRLHFLDVGQGDCTIVEFPSGHVVVIDGGDGAFYTNLHLVRYLKALAPETLTLVATHADSDHSGGLAYLLKNFGAKEVYLPPIGSQTGAYRSLLREVERTETPKKTLSRYSVLSDESGAYALCISPYSVGETDENDASAVLFLRYAGVNILLGADISSSREKEIMDDFFTFDGIFDVGGYTAPLRETDILRVSHHGSNSSSSEGWLSFLGAQTAILSCGAGNSYGHPAPEAVERLKMSGAALYRTDELGDVMITISPDGAYRVEWKHYR